MTGGELRTWRLRRGLTMLELARVIGKSLSAVKRWLAAAAVPIARTVAQLIECIDLLLARGIIPPSWPPRLARRVWAAA